MFTGHPPRGLLRFIARLPILLYRWGFGSLLGSRFLLLNHQGRVSGKMRNVVLEVLRHDRDDGSYLICSAWGEKADWYRNLQAHPRVRIQVAGRELDCFATFPQGEEAEAELELYAQNHPVASRLLFLMLRDQNTEKWVDLTARVRLVRLLRPV